MATQQSSVATYRCPECDGAVTHHDGSWQCTECTHAPRHGAD